MYADFLKILICLLTISQTCFASDPPYSIKIQVQDEKTGKAISNAEITIDLPGRAPIIVSTDTNGFVGTNISVTQDYTGRLVVKAGGYKRYVQNIDFINIISYEVQLEPEERTPFQYSVEVQDKETGESIENARVIIDVEDRILLKGSTGPNGSANVSIDEDYAGKRGCLTFEAKGYEIYKKENIYLTEENLPQKVFLNPKEEKYNRLGLAMGYTRFKNIKNMGEVTYMMAGVVYARRFIFFYLFDLACYGYADLTIMTSLNSEKTLESEATNTEITFDRASSASINYTQSVLFGKGFSLLIETGFQWLGINDNQGNKLIEKTNLLIGGGFEYSYKRFFVQANLSTVIGEDKSLGHDLDATIKTGINF
jgi:hypothetical protein